MPFQKINDITLHYEISGEGQPLLLIHGLGSSLRDWEYQTPEFIKHFQVIALDLRGHGQTSKPSGPYSMKLFADDVAAFLNFLNLKSVHIMGISMGNAVGFEMAIHYPNLVKSLIGVNMGASLSVKTLQERIQFFKRILIVKLAGMKKMGEFLGPMLFPDPTMKHLQKLLAERWAENNKKAYLSSFRALKNWSVEDSLGDIQCPTLIIASDGDYTAVPIKETIVEKIPNATLIVVDNAHHAVPMEKPHEFNKIVMEYLTHQG